MVYAARKLRSLKRRLVSANYSTACQDQNRVLKGDRRSMSTTPTQVNFDVKNLDLADLGKRRIDWANQSMKVLQIIRKEFIKNQPLKGIRISACLHVTAET